MSTAVASRLGDYGRSIALFQAATGGAYSGPSMPLGLLQELVDSADGIDTGALVSSVEAAVGVQRAGNGGKSGAGSSGSSSGSGAWSLLRDIIQKLGVELAAGSIFDFLGNIEGLGSADAQQREELVDQAEECASAIDDVVHVSETSIEEILGAAIPLLGTLTSLVSKIHPLARALVPIIASAGDEIIEHTNGLIAQTCRDRDDTIERCYDALEHCCEQACSTELPTRVPDAATCAPPPACPAFPPVSAPPACPTQDSVSGTAPALAPASAPAPTPPAPASAPSPTPPSPAAPPPVTTPASTAPACPSPAPSQPAPAVATTPSNSVPPAECAPPAPNQPRTTPSSTPPTPRPAGEPQRTPPAPHECECPEPAEAHDDCVDRPATPVPGETKPPADCDTVLAQEPVVVEECLTDEPVAPEPAVERDVETQNDCEETGVDISTLCSGFLGGFGVGVAIIGTGLLIAAAVDFVSHLELPDVAPEPAPEPVLEPAPQPERAPEPPAPASVKKDDGVYTPPAELDDVKEPAPPPKKLEHMAGNTGSAQAGVPVADTPAPAAPAQSDASSAAPPSAPAPAAPVPPPGGSSSRARKAGQW